MREKLYGIVSGTDESLHARGYAVAMVAIIVASLVPLCFRETNMAFTVIETVCVTIFIFDYLVRWATADYKLKKGALSFLMYPFTPMAIIDLVSIIPFFVALNPAWRALRVTRVFMSLRAFKLLRYSTGLSLIVNAVARQAVSLFFVGLFSVAYVLVSAIIIFNAEPETFPTYFEAVYWAVITLATVGYGDLYPVTDVGRVISIASAFAGVAIVALPASIITAGVMQELGGLQTVDKS